MRYLPIVLAVIAAASPIAARAQIVDTDPGRSVRTREDLERLLSEYESALASPAYSESVKRSIRADSARIQDRLDNGDFRVGDRIEINVQGEPNYPVTVTVEPGPMISLDLFGDISLAGVLRSEITEHLTEALSHFIRDPVVRATAQMRVAVLGAVGQPGFYTLPAETLIGDALMAAGGPSGTANLEDLEIERAGQALYSHDEIQDAVQAGLTLDQLNLQAGDQIVVPAQGTGSIWRSVMAVIGAAGTLSWLIFRVTN